MRSPGPGLRRSLVRAVLAVVGTVTVLTAGAGTASAHAYLQTSNPAQGSVLKVSPPQVVLHFSEQVGTSLSEISVLDAAGANHATGSPVHPFGQANDLAVFLQPQLGDGTYLVVWRVVADDSHPTAGSFSFSVGKAGNVATADTSTNPDPQVNSLLGFGRLLGFIGVAAFFGGVLFVLVCWPAGAGSVVSRRTLATGWLLAFVGAAASFLLEGPYGAGSSLAHAFDWSLVKGVTETRYGQALVARVVLLALAAFAGTVLLRKPSRGTAVAFGVLSVATLVTFPYTGHPSVGTVVPVAVASDVLHLSAMCVWFGGLLLLAVVVLPDEGEDTVRTVVARFSPIAMAAVGVLVVTGVYQAWREAGVVGALRSTHYGHLLLIKTAIVVVVLCVAEFSRRWVGRTAHGQEPDVRRLGLSVSIETALVVVVLAVTSLLVAGVPGRTDFRPSTVRHLVAGPVHLELSVDPSATRVINLRVDSTDAQGKPMHVSSVALNLRLADPSAGPLNVPLAAIGMTQFQATGVELPYTGRWAVTLVAKAEDQQQYTTRTSLAVR